MTFLLLLITLEIIYHVDKTNARRVLISLLLSVTGLLSGCASHNENASLLAKKQAQNISQNLPIKSAGYTLVLAQSSGTTVKMTIISEAGAQTTQTPDAF